MTPRPRAESMVPADPFKAMNLGADGEQLQPPVYLRGRFKSEGAKGAGRKERPWSIIQKLKGFWG